MTSKTIFQAFLVLLFAYFYYNYSWEENVGEKSLKLSRIVQTESGSVQGSIRLSRDGREFEQWLKIPYAKPPIGILRFASPQPIGKWNGILDGTRNGPNCPQYGLIGFEGDEDCLQLNIHVPKLDNLDNNSLLPVLVWIHGGAFIFGGGGMYGPEYFMDEPVVLITINYRLSVLGFLSTGDKQIRGNMGLKDQVTALQWIQENIKYFNGDPSRVTIIGDSAGGASTHHLMLTQKTRGLFQKAISMSGVTIAPWGLVSTKVALEKAKSIGKQLNCPTENSQVLTDCLRKLDMPTLLSAYQYDSEYLCAGDPTQKGEITSPVIETINDEEAFLVESPFDILREGRSQKIPWLNGFVADEGLYIAFSIEKNRQNLKILDENWNENMERALFLSSLPTESKNEILGKIRDFYFPPGKIMTDDEKFQSYVRIFSDSYFKSPASIAGSIQRQFSDVYMYHVNKTGGPTVATFLLAGDPRNMGFVQIFLMKVNQILKSFGFGGNPKIYGMAHLDDVFLLFPFMKEYVIPKNEKDDVYQFSKDFVKFILDFAVAEKSMKFRNVPLPPTLKTGTLKYMKLEENPNVGNEPEEPVLKFWKSLDIQRKTSESIKKSSNK